MSALYLSIAAIALTICILLIADSDAPPLKKLVYIAALAYGITFLIKEVGLA